VRFGAPSLFIGDMMRRMPGNGALAGTNARLQICCDSSANLLHGIRCGYLEIACVLGDEPEIVQAAHTWTEDFVWTRAPDVTLRGREEVPLISSPNRVLPDRIALEALARANRAYEIVFSAHDRAIRYAAAQSGMGYMPVPRRSVPPTLAIDENLSPLRRITAAIVTRDGLDLAETDSLVASIRDTLHGCSTPANRLGAEVG
jgi:DNA-binding transcriptional LysR family regulator